MVPKRLFVLVIVASAVFVGCGGPAGKGITSPTVSVVNRHSYVSEGLVMRITNTGEQPLGSLKVQLEGSDDAPVLVAEKLLVGETVEVGWVEFGKNFKSGDTVLIYSNDYLLPARAAFRSSIPVTGPMTLPLI